MRRQLSQLVSEIEKVKNKLSQISNVKPGDKINVYAKYNQPPTLATKLLRTIWYRYESRDVTELFIQNVIDEAFEIIQEIQRSNFINWIKRLNKPFTK